MPIKHDAASQEFTTTRHGHKAELAYTQPAPGLLDFTHTFVAEELRGQGVGDELARAGLAYARQKGLKVKTSCSFMAAFVQRHQADYQDVQA
ncbi:MAG: GNAT family N-acetyltransferase [Hymenobacter sp.]